MEGSEKEVLENLRQKEGQKEGTVGATPEDMSAAAPESPAEPESVEEAEASEDDEEEEAGEDELEMSSDGQDAGGGPAGEGRTWAERKAAKRQAKQDKKAEAYKEKIDQLEDRVKRQIAEFENFRKRTEKEKIAMFETGARSVIEKILPVADNFERGLATVPAETKDDPFVEGMNKVYRQMVTELENIGVRSIEALGKEFDPQLHNAVMQVESKEYEPGIVAQELQKGYTYRDSVVRHSMVAVVS
jgi:molecular chaperone GrpE